MAVDARHLNLVPPQILCNRYDMNLMNIMEGTGNVYSAGIVYGTTAAATAALGPKATAETVMPTYGPAITESFPAKTAAATIKAADSGLTYALPPPVTAEGGSRKRSRDDNINQLLSFAAAARNNHNHHRHPSSVSAAATVSPFTFLGEDISYQIQRQQFEIDRLITQHNEKVRMEVEETSKRNSRRIIAAVEESVTKKLKAKDEEIGKINKLNWALEERVKTLCVENQMWRDLAQMNEATGNALRTNLEQVLAGQRQRHQEHGGDGAAVAALELADDAESCCGSNFDDEMDGRTLANGAADSIGDWCSLAAASNINGNGNDGCVNGAGKVNGNNKLCRSCGREESCVLLLPCRHLCLCTVCGSSLHVCPICKSPKNASLHVNF